MSPPDQEQAEEPQSLASTESRKRAWLVLIEVPEDVEVTSSAQQEIEIQQYRGHVKSVNVEKGVSIF